MQEHSIGIFCIPLCSHLMYCFLPYLQAHMQSDYHVSHNPEQSKSQRCIVMTGCINPWSRSSSLMRCWQGDVWKTGRGITSMARLCSTRAGVVCCSTTSFMLPSCASMASVTRQGSLHLAR